MTGKQALLGRLDHAETALLSALKRLLEDAESWEEHDYRWIVDRIWKIDDLLNELQNYLENI